MVGTVGDVFGVAALQYSMPVYRTLWINGISNGPFVCLPCLRVLDSRGVSSRLRLTAQVYQNSDLAYVMTINISSRMWSVGADLFAL